MANEKQIVDALEKIVTELSEGFYQNDGFNTKSDFNGYTVADSLGVIADSMFKISETFERMVDNQTK